MVAEKYFTAAGATGMIVEYTINLRAKLLTSLSILISVSYYQHH